MCANGMFKEQKMKKMLIFMVLIIANNYLFAKDKNIDPIFKRIPVIKQIPDTLIKINPDIHSENFVNYATWIIPKWNEIHELYANDVAIKAVKQNGKIFDGSIFVSKVFKPISKNNQYVMDGEHYKKGTFIRTDVMESKTSWGELMPNEASTGNFNYARFKNETGSVQIKIDQGQCISCHLSKVDENYLFSIKELEEYVNSYE